MTRQWTAAGIAALALGAAACATHLVPGWSRNPRYAGCSREELHSISPAFARAARMSDAALEAANDPANLVRAESDAWGAYQRWFGDFHPARFASVQAVLAATRAEFERTITMSCGATKENCSGFASADHDVRVVRLCTAFFARSLADQAAILFHELTRISSNTEDVIYREYDVLALARTDPGKAVRNAESYAAFAESVAFGLRPDSLGEAPDATD